MMPQRGRESLELRCHCRRKDAAGSASITKPGEEEEAGQSPRLACFVLRVAAALLIVPKRAGTSHFFRLPPVSPKPVSRAGCAGRQMPQYRPQPGTEALLASLLAHCQVGPALLSWVLLGALGSPPRHLHEERAKRKEKQMGVMGSAGGTSRELKLWLRLQQQRHGE